jgi:hypothetical protein
MAHRRGICVETNDELARRTAGMAQDGPSPAGADIDDHPFRAGNQRVELADVHLELLATDDLFHATQFRPFSRPR